MVVSEGNHSAEDGRGGWSRIEVTWSDSGSLRKATGFERYDSAAEDLRAEGYGSLAEIAAALGISGGIRDLHPDSPSFCCLVGYAPVRIASVQQVDGRSKVAIRLQDGRPYRGQRLLHLRYRGDGLSPPASVALSDQSPNEVFISAKREGAAEVTLSLGGSFTQSASIDLLPRLAVSPRTAVLRLVEGRDLILEGLDGAKYKGRNDHTRQSAPWFERSVAHLFAELGLSTFWWGRGNKISPDLPMPIVRGDGLVFASAEQLLALLECTLEIPGQDKILDLLQRARTVEASLRNELGCSAPAVTPVLATALDQAGMSRTVLRIADEDGIAVLDRGILLRARRLLLSGASPTEVWSTFPIVLQPRRPERLW